jgi:hypothetical protein
MGAAQVTHVKVLFGFRIGTLLEEALTHQIDQALKPFSIDRTVPADNPL